MAVTYPHKAIFRKVGLETCRKLCGRGVSLQKVNFRNETSIGRECKDGSCAYFERVDYPVMKNVLGYHVKIDTQQIIEERIALNFYGGLGIRYININTSAISEGDNIRGRELFNINPVYPGKYTLLRVHLG